MRTQCTPLSRLGASPELLTMFVPVALAPTSIAVFGLWFCCLCLAGPVTRVWRPALKPGCDTRSPFFHSSSLSLYLRKLIPAKAQSFTPQFLLTLPKALLAPALPYISWCKGSLHAELWFFALALHQQFPTSRLPFWLPLQTEWKLGGDQSWWFQDTHSWVPPSGLFFLFMLLCLH